MGDDVYGAAAAAAAAETSLPVALLREIFCFAHAPSLLRINAEADSAFATRATQPSTAGLRALARVCSTWQRVAHELLASFAQRELTLQFTVGSEEAEQLAHEAHLRVHGHSVVHLHVRILAPPRQQLWWEALAAADTSLQSQWIDWHALFQHLPNVQRLDLAHVPLHHFTLSDILAASSTHCAYMQALVLPKRDPSHTDAVDATIDSTFRALYAALRAWHATPHHDSNDSGSSSRGLRQLTIPSHSAFEPETTSTEFLDAIATLCPVIEYLDGWKVSYCEKRFVRSDRSLSVSSASWRVLCRTCTHLREFSWVVVPFADAFFEPFGATPKPQLTHLQLTYNVAAPFRIIRSEYSTRGLCALLRGTPALVVLDVVLHRIQSAHALVYPHLDEMIDGAAFDDCFAAQLARCCPRLERLHIRAVDKAFPLLSAITDDGLRALAGLRRLRCVELLGAKCSARVLLALLLDGAADVPSRSVKVRELGSRFGEVATELLQLLSSGDTDEHSAVARLQRLSSNSKPLLLSIACRRGFVFPRRDLDAASAQMQHRGVRFVAVLADKPASRDKDGLARVVPRFGGLLASRDIARIGRLVVYTDQSLLSKRLRAQVSRAGDMCVVQL